MKVPSSSPSQRQHGFAMLRPFVMLLLTVLFFSSSSSTSSLLKTCQAFQQPTWTNVNCRTGPIRGNRSLSGSFGIVQCSSHVSSTNSDHDEVYHRGAAEEGDGVSAWIPEAPTAVAASIGILGLLSLSHVDPAMAAAPHVMDIVDAAGSMVTAAAGSSSTVVKALLAWAHFVGIIGIAGGLASERLLLQYNMPLEVENKINTADLVYGLSAFSMLASGVGRALNEKGFGAFYAHEPIFWLKMVSVAVLGGLSFFPVIVFLRRDLARREDRGNIHFAPLSDAMIDRLTTIINAEILAVLSIPLMASLMARGVSYWSDFPAPIGMVLYVAALGAAGYKYGKEAFDTMESEGAL
eukprot:CAMPEP_0113495130 /NCGR_PEP_ID=MMETSP0014_2-20120614/29456_1 /TAXON_ID=2857 /ORGANISM="Nitzschia sp." /LENGTH=350 /DNA_ID=CAMNT_0000389029 /DNA_START=21 /DNA_END=1069 /DNA_ORIENTATION=+ /assembly_acc=CAM_ASM_000159